jgi:nitroreductase
MVTAGGHMLGDTVTPEIDVIRKPDYEVAPLLLDRWSPRSMTGEPLADDELFPLFEAARWAPSSFNSQLWRFIVARRQSPVEFAKFLDLLVAANRPWAQNAGALIVVASRARFEHNDKPSITHAFDAGAAWENLALEACRRQLVAHGMEGFDYARAKADLSIPDDFDVHAMIAIGHRAPAENLPEKYRAKEHPTSRRPLREIVFEGTFGKSLDRLP